MISTASFSTPHTPTNSDRREHQMRAEWRRERAAARRAARAARQTFRPRLRLRIAG